MSSQGTSQIPEIVKKHEADLLAEWSKELALLRGQGSGRIKEAELREQCSGFLRAFQEAIQSGKLSGITGESWATTREMLSEVSRSRSLQGFSPSETAIFVFSLKGPLLARMRRELGKDPELLVNETTIVNDLLDKLGLYTTEVYQKSREEVISRQQQEMMELSTPVVKMWEGVLALPLIGTLDSARTQVVMESLLQAIVQTGAEVAIIDITGVPTVDTLVAQHLIKTVTAARLMGTDCIISGIRPQIAQTIVHLGVDLSGVTTKASLADALALALKRSGFIITKAQTAK
jgi:rsbT co-antagonist protein RsbR